MRLILTLLLYLPLSSFAVELNTPIPIEKNVAVEKKDPFDLFPLEEPHPDASQENRFLGEFFYMLFMLGLLIGVVMFASYILKKMTATRMEAINESSRVKITERRNLSQRTQIHIVEIDDKEFLIVEGVAGITALPLQAPCTDSDSTL